MLPTAIPSLALISAYGTGGSAVSRAISRWQQSGRSPKRLAQRCAALGGQQFLVRRPDALVREALSVQHVPGRLRSLGCAQDPRALAPGGGGEPAWKRGRIADPIQLIHQVQPDALADVLGVRVA